MNSEFFAILEAIQFNENHLVPAIAQQYDSQEVLMMAWMNQTAIIETLTTHQVCYYSRSRKKLWRKGETSGQVQILKQMRIDCDGDTILLLVDQKGVACHTGRKSCFYQAVDKQQLKVISDPLIEPSLLYPSYHTSSFNDQ